MSMNPGARYRPAAFPENFRTAAMLSPNSTVNPPPEALNPEHFICEMFYSHFCHRLCSLNATESNGTNLLKRHVSLWRRRPPRVKRKRSHSVAARLGGKLGGGGHRVRAAFRWTAYA